MAEPRVPGSGGDGIELPCGETITPHDLDMGLREYDCACGDRHAVVMDIHPLGRFVPESLADVLRATVEPADEFDEFTTAHLMGMVLEEFPEAVVAEDLSEDGQVGYSLLWLSDFDSRRLHEIVVELLVELMEHAMSHAGDDDAMAEFEAQMLEFDVEEFVERYRQERDFDSEYDTAI
ncbi:DUF5815 family protein [Halorientalis brevis]|uniref:DUF5815 family protein n=1 Tax=Halorientalis brevis TaxID=1126241 RepID=A0ABD6C7H8_9EURY|nr:DUF5815 family protein [Halorientalis brevis]